MSIGGEGEIETWRSSAGLRAGKLRDAPDELWQIRPKQGFPARQADGLDPKVDSRFGDVH
jgi:hypothetical protein